ncbi:MAG: hypothetical protein L0Y55_13845 [Anaerolineales bacterium]|nr:hypothetical protein [Anaerolineales bacterium]
MDDDQVLKQAQQPEPGVTRQTYAKPAIIYRAPLETTAAACVPVPPAKGTPALCPQGPIST